MFVVLLTYKKPLEVVEHFLPEHVNYLTQGYDRNFFIVSGRKNPRTGGVILSQLEDREQLEGYIKLDPFYINEIADFEIIEFIPSMYNAAFSSFIKE